jgi:hypothetical protein
MRNHELVVARLNPKHVQQQANIPLLTGNNRRCGDFFHDSDPEIEV